MAMSLHEAHDDKMAADPYLGSGSSSQPSSRTVFSQVPRVPTMDAKSRRPKERESAIPALNAAIEATNLAKEIAGIASANAAFGSVGDLLTMVRVCFLPFCGDGPQIHMYPGFGDKRGGLR